MQKMAPKSSYYLRNETILKIGNNGHCAKPPLQSGQFGSKIKIAKCMRKTAVETHYSCIMQKRAPKKQLPFEKWDHFENWQKRPQCKGYSLCKVVTLPQKIKMPKTCDKRLYKHIRLVLCKKGLQKAANIWEMRPFWKLANMATMQRLQPMQGGHFGSKIKIAKSMR